MQNKTNNLFSFYSRIFLVSATLLVAGFLSFLLPTTSFASTAYHVYLPTPTVNGSYYDLDLSGGGSVMTGITEANTCPVTDGLNGYEVFKGTYPDTSTLIGGASYSGAHWTDYAPPSGPSTFVTTGNGDYWIRMKKVNRLGGCYVTWTTGDYAYWKFSMTGSIATPESAIPPDGFVSQTTPVNGQNNFTTIRFTGTYADATAHFERIFVTFNDVYPTIAATSFTELYTIPAASGVAIPYDFVQTFTAGHTYEYQMLLAKADGTGQTSLTSAVAFGTTATNNITGVVVAGSGTITNPSASGVVTGLGTHFLSTLKVGDLFSTAGGNCTILSIVSDTELQCTPITGANSAVSFTHTPQINLAVTYDACSTFDIFCYGKNLFVWAFIPASESLQQFASIVNFSSPKDSLLATKFPFAYGFDIANMWNELFDTTASGTLGISVPNLGGGSVDLLSANTISANSWYGSIVRPFISVGLYLMAFWILYKKVFGIHDKDHKTV